MKKTVQIEKCLLELSSMVKGGKGIHVEQSLRHPEEVFDINFYCNH